MANEDQTNDVLLAIKIAAIAVVVVSICLIVISVLGLKGVIQLSDTFVRVSSVGFDLGVFGVVTGVFVFWLFTRK